MDLEPSLDLCRKRGWPGRGRSSQSPTEGICAYGPCFRGPAQQPLRFLLSHFRGATAPPMGHLMPPRLGFQWGSPQRATEPYTWQMPPTAPSVRYISLDEAAGRPEWG